MLRDLKITEMLINFIVSKGLSNGKSEKITFIEAEAEINVK